MRHARPVAPGRVQFGPGLIVGGLLVAAFVQAGVVAGDRGSPAPDPTAAPLAADWTGPTLSPPTASAPVAALPATPLSTAPLAAAAAPPLPTSAGTPKPTPAMVYAHHQAGRAAWGYLDGRVVTRLPAGTRIKVCGKLGCWEGTSYGYGPAESTGYLVDLDATIFERICGPLGQGVADAVLYWP